MFNPLVSLEATCPPGVTLNPLVPLKPPELLKAADVQTHVCAKLSRICAIFFTFERKSGENCPNFVFLTQSDKVFFNHMCFYGIFSACLCAKFNFENAVCAKEFTFRRSGNHLSPCKGGRQPPVHGRQQDHSDQGQGALLLRPCQPLA